MVVAIYNYNSNSKISDITGSFISNSSTFNGGAIYNYNYSTITSITGDFINNTAGSNGGAIYNYNSTLGYLTGDFIANTANFSGGAIYNSTTTSTTTISGNFISNVAKNGSGGAIYTSTPISFIANNHVNTFTDNYTANNGVIDYNAIYTNGANLDFNMSGTGGFTINDSILGSSSGYNLTITGESTNNTFTLNDIISNFSSFNITNATLKLGSYTHSNGTTTTASFGSSTNASISLSNTNLTIDTSAFTGITSGTAVINGNNSYTLSVEGTSTLTLENTTVATYTIFDSFAETTGLWDASNINVSNTLLEFSVSGDGVENPYQVTVSLLDSSPLYDGAMGDIVDDLVHSQDFGDVNSLDPVIRFISQVTQSSVGDTSTQKRIIDAAGNMATISGVEANTYEANRAARDLLGIRTSFFNEQENSSWLWILPIYSHESVSRMSSVDAFRSDYKTDMYGVIFGADKTIITNNIVDLYRFGLAVNMGSGQTYTSGDFEYMENNFDFFGVSLYSAVKWNNFTLSANIGYTYNQSEASQNLSSYSIDSLKLNVDSDALNFSIRAEYFYKTSFMNIIPYIGADFITLHTNDYSVDSDSGTIFEVKSDRQNLFTFPLGVTFTKELKSQNDWSINPKARIGVILAVGDLESRSVSSAKGYSSIANVETDVVDPASFDFNLGLEAIKNNFGLSLDYTLQLSNHRKAHALMGTLKYKF